MADIKDPARIAAKWARVTPQRSTDYAEGIETPRRDWAGASAAAADTYRDGVTKAAQSGQYVKGIRAAGSERWQRRARAKGPQRFSEGVQLSEPDYAQGFEPYAATIRATTLPPRFPKGDPRNLARVTAIATALNRRRTGAAQ